MYRASGVLLPTKPAKPAGKASNATHALPEETTRLRFCCASWKKIILSPFPCMAAPIAELFKMIDGVKVAELGPEVLQIILTNDAIPRSSIVYMP